MLKRRLIVVVLSLLWMACHEGSDARWNVADPIPIHELTDVGMVSEVAFAPRGDTDRSPPPAAADVSDEFMQSGVFDQCVDGLQKKSPKSTQARVYFGTTTPKLLPMTSGQIMAVGNFWGCSGLLVAPRWVLTASHCGLWDDTEFCMGAQPHNPSTCVPAKRVIDHPVGDISLVELQYDATQWLPGVEPVALLTETLNDSWLGSMAEAAGYGEMETGFSGVRKFTSEPIVYLGWDTLTLDGKGQQGVCFGDSGGPVMVLASDGSVRVAGTLSGGDGSCVGQDDFTRVDVYLEWLESYMGPTMPTGPQPCGDVDTKGHCNEDGTWAIHCGANNQLQVDVCGVGQRCSWSSGQNAWRCMDAAQDPCNGLTYWGKCFGNVLQWCDEGGWHARNCYSCNETCVPNDTMGYFCVPSTCGTLEFTGHCVGNTVEWCNRDGQPESRNCAASGQACAYVNPQMGHWCVDP